MAEASIANGPLGSVEVTCFTRRHVSKNYVYWFTKNFDYDADRVVLVAQKLLRQPQTLSESAAKDS